MPVIKLFANLRKLAGTKELSVAGSSVRAVLGELVKWNPPVGEIVVAEGELRPHIIVTVNGHNVIDLDTLLTEQDVVAIFPPIAGG